MIRKDDASFNDLFVAHPMPMWLYELESLRFVAVNTAAMSHYGYTEDEFLGMTIKDIRPAQEKLRLQANLAQAQRDTLEKSGIWRHLKKDGTPIDVEITSHPLQFNGKACKYVLAHDVTERLRAEDKVARLNRIYAVLSGINSTIVRTRDRAELFSETCRIATEEGEFISAYIGTLDPLTQTGHTVAVAGTPLPGFTDMPLSMDGAANAWPPNRAMAQRIAFICNDLHQDPQLAHLAAQGAAANAMALAAFPLYQGARVAGVLVLLADAPDSFDPEECRLLAELASDVSYALQNIEREELHTRITRRLEESEAGLRRAQLTNKIAHIITGADGRCESWSETMPLLLGVAPHAMPPDARSWMEMIHPDDRDIFRRASLEAQHQGQRIDAEYRLVRGDGSLVQFRQVSEPLPGTPAANGATRWFNTIQDISEQKQQLERNARLSRIYAVSSEVNSAIVRIHKRDELFQEVCRVAVHEGTFSLAWIGAIDPVTQDGAVVAWCGGRKEVVDRIRLTAREGQPTSLRPASMALRERRAVICNDIASDPMMAFAAEELLKNGHRATVALPLVHEGRSVAVLTLLADSSGFFDDAEIKLLNDVVGDLNFALQYIDNEQRLSYLAYYDSLTGLANAKLLDDRLTQLIHANRGEMEQVEIILLNLDRFAQLNDALGRRAGDELLKAVAKRLLESLPEDYTLARISGSTFAILIADVNQFGDVTRVLEQDILAPLLLPFQLEQQEVRISVRAGLAQFPGDGDNAEALFKHAEIALRNAKNAGERYAFYAPGMNAAHATRLAMENELRHALEAKEFDVFYQPRIDLVSGRIVSAEALIRWRHPKRGMVPPGSFIPLAEEIGLIVPLGMWVMDTVCAQQAAWQRAGLGIVPVAVNLSAVQFKQANMLDTFHDMFRVHDLAPEFIEFEITESMMMNDPAAAAESLKALKGLGTQLALDDFGTGYSSLAYLQRFPFDIVKIDRAFIIHVTSNPGDAAIVTAVIAMAHSLQLRVVAEGVENQDQLDFLRERKCDEMQGYLFSPAVPGPDFAAMLRDGQCMTFELTFEEMGYLGPDPEGLRPRF